MMKVALEFLETKPDPIVYVACFSWEPDDLAQWRAYGEGDAPVAIEFEHGPLMFGYTSEGLLNQVHYDLEEQKWVFDQVVKAYQDTYAEDLRNPTPNARRKPLSIEEECALCANSLCHDLWRYIVSCKHPTFRSEREVRFTYTAHDFSKNGRNWYPEHPTPKFRQNRGRIIPYLTSKNLNFQNLPPIGEVPPLSIRSVRIGPTQDKLLIERGVRRLLNVHGYSAVPILHSGSPFRKC